MTTRTLDVRHHWTDGAVRAGLILAAFLAGYLLAQAPAPDFSTLRERVADPVVQDWHGNVRRSGGPGY